MFLRTDPTTKAQSMTCPVPDAGVLMMGNLGGQAALPGGVDKFVSLY